MRLCLSAAVVGCFAFAAVACAAEQPERFELDSVKISEVARLVYGEALHEAYLLDPAVVDDARLVSVRWEGPQSQVRAFIASFLKSLGYSVERRGTLDYVAKAKDEPPKDPEKKAFVYRPDYRDVAYLTDILRPMVSPGAFGEARPASTAPIGTANLSTLGSPAMTGSMPTVGTTGTLSAIGAGASPVPGAVSGLPSLASGRTGAAAETTLRDVLVCWCTDDDRTRIEAVLPQIDTAEGDLIVRATVYEVTSDRSTGSALQLAGTILGGHLGVQFGPAAPLGEALTLKNTKFQAVLSALDSDSRFKVLSSPVAHARSGTAALFKSGQDVPTLASISYPGGGTSSTPVQSVDYRSAGVIFSVKPTMREKTIAVDVQQELSNFVETTNGVNNSPTLVERSLTSSLSVAPGDVVVLGGLVEDDTNESKNGLFDLPEWLSSKSSDQSRTEIMLVLQVLTAPGEADMRGHLVSAAGEVAPR